MAAGKPRDAIRAFEEAQRAGDTWLGRFNLGRAYVEAGAYVEAHSELEQCLKRCGEATAVYLDDVPTFRLIPTLHYWMARAQEGLHSPAAAKTFKTYLSMKKSDEDPEVLDARRRSGAR